MTAMDSDMEMNNLERLLDDEDEDDNDHEYSSNDDGAVRALLTQNARARGHWQDKEPATRTVATLWNQIGGIVVEVSTSTSSCPSTF